MKVELAGRAVIVTGAASGIGAATAARAAPGRIDGLVNAAGITTRTSALGASLGDRDTLFAINARAPFLLMQAALADMSRRGVPGAPS